MTPRRILLLLGGLFAFGAVYAIYARIWLARWTANPRLPDACRGGSNLPASPASNFAHDRSPQARLSRERTGEPTGVLSNGFEFAMATPPLSWPREAHRVVPIPIASR